MCERENAKLITDGEPGLVVARREETRSCVHNERCEPRVSREGNIPQTLKKIRAELFMKEPGVPRKRARRRRGGRIPFAISRRGESRGSYVKGTVHRSD